MSNEIFDLNNFNIDYHSTDYEQFRDWYNDNNEDKIPSTESKLKATDIQYILFCIWLVTKYKIVSLQNLDDLVTLILPTIDKLNKEWDFNTNESFYYGNGDNEDDIMEYESEEEIERNFELKEYYDELLMIYSDLMNVSFHKIQENMKNDYESIRNELIRSNYEDNITFQMMINNLQQGIIIKFIIEMFGDVDDLNENNILSLIEYDINDLKKLFENIRKQSQINYVVIE
jgi:hypothetical protein